MQSGRGHRKCLKDQNFLKINHDLDYKLIDIPVYEQLKIKESLLKDSMFLSKHGLMDYSMLLTVEYTDCFDR